MHSTSGEKEMKGYLNSCSFGVYKGYLQSVDKHPSVGKMMWGAGKSNILVFRIAIKFTVIGCC